MASGRSTIKTRISLEGGQQIEKDLKALGKAGEDAFSQIQKAAAKIRFAEFGAALKKAGNDLSTVGKRLTLAFAGLAAAGTAAGIGMVKLAKDSADVVDAQADAAEGLGLTIEELGKLQFAAKLSGQSLDVLEPSLARFAATLGEAQAGTKSAVEKFTALGIQLRRSDGTFKGTAEVFLDVAEAISRMPDGARKSAIASDLLGKSFAKLLPLLNEGRTGLQGLFDQAERAGVVFSEADKALAGTLNDSFDAMGKSILALKTRLGLLFAPPIIAAVQTFTEFIDQNRQALLDLARAAVDTGISIVRDLINAFTGNDSAVVRTEILAWRDSIKQFGADVRATFQDVLLPTFRALQEAARVVAEGINAIFGTDFTGGTVAMSAAILGLVGAFSALGSIITAAVTGLTLVAGVIGAPMLAAIAAFGAAIAGVVIFWEDLTAAAQKFSDTVVEVASQFASWLASTDIGAALLAGFDAAVAGIKKGLAELLRFGGDVIRKVGNFVEGLINRINAAISRLARLGSNGPNVEGGELRQGFARGGRVWGPGGPTADRVPALLSNGEWVMRSAAVKKYGVRLMAALNSMRLPADAFAPLRGFSLGGLADSLRTSMTYPVPRFAGGGLANLDFAPAGPSGRPVNLTIDGRSFPLSGAVDVVGDLARHITTRATSSTGRAPSWKR